MSDVKIIRVLDFESAAATPAEGGLVEVGYADLIARSLDLAGQPMDWEVIGGRARLCHPGCSIPPETEAIHHIGDSDVADQPNWMALLAGLLKAGPKDGVIAYSAYGAEFELQFMNADWMGTPVPPMLDVYKIALRVWGEQAPHHSNRALQYWRKPVGLNKADALPNHRAYPDALVTAFLLRDLLNDEGTPLEQMVAWSLEPALTVKCYLGDYRNDGKGTPWSGVETSYLDWIVNKAGFHDKPDIRFTAAYHLERRIMDQREAEERDELNAQFRDNGMEELPSTNNTAQAADLNQTELVL